MYKKNSYLVLMMILISMFAAQSVFGYTIMVRPQEAIVDLGAGMEFEAQAYSEDNTPIVVDSFEWSVSPAKLGTINDDGFFEAGDEPGVGKIVASAVIGGQRYAGTADLLVGAPAEDGIVIEIDPDPAVVSPGKSKSFKAVAKGKEGVSLRTQNVRWMIEPENLGNINAKGEFKANNKFGYGKVVSLVEIDNQIYKGSADVIVSQHPTSVVSGEIVDETGLPLVDAKVTATRIGFPVYFKKAITAEDGSYLLDKLIPGHYILHAELQGFVPEYYDDRTFFAEANPLEVAEDDTLEAIDFVLEKGASISGQITISEAETPVEGVHISAYLLLNPLRHVHAYSDENGNYQLQGLVSGSYVVYANKAGFIGEFYDDSKRLFGADLVEVEGPNETPDINFALDQTSAITGVIKSDVDDSPIEGAYVYVSALITDNRHNIGKKIVVRTNENGEYTAQVEPGKYLAEAFATGFAGEWYEDKDEPSTADIIQVTDTEHAVADFGLAPLGLISGIVIDQETGLAIEGAVVTASGEHRQQYHQRYFSTKTDENGEYAFQALPEGDYYIMAAAKEYLPEFWEEQDSLKNATKVTVEDGVETGAIDFTLQKGASIAGSVIDSETATPIPYATITLKKLEKPLHIVVNSDADGLYNISGLPAGSYVVSAVARGYYKEWYEEAADFATADTLVVEESEQVESVNFTLLKQDQTGAGIAGTVIDSETELPIDGATIAVIPLTFAHPKRAVTGENGTYEMLGLQPGDYLVVAYAPGYLGEFFNDTRYWLDAETVTVTEDLVTPDINFDLDLREEGLYMVTGTVTDPSGNPVEGAMIVAEDEGEVVATEMSDVDGTYTLSNMPSGSYVIKATSVAYEDGYYEGQTEDSEAVVLSDGSNQYDVALNLEATVTSVGNNAGAPTDFALMQNYPNPFNPVTSIQFTLPAEAQVKLRIYNVLGKEVKLLETGLRQAGSFTVQWDGTDNNGAKLSSGLYIYKLEADSNGEKSVQVRRMLMLK